MSTVKPKLYIHVGQATHFLEWELPEFAKYFKIVDSPSRDVSMLVFGPDVLEQGLDLPALRRYAVLFPGFGHNPVYNQTIKLKHRQIIPKYNLVFINPGPLEIAYKNLKNVMYYPFSVNVNKVNYTKPRKKIARIIHISSDYPQKDWRRSEEIMKKTGLRWEVYPSRHKQMFPTFHKALSLIKYRFFLRNSKIPPNGYVEHEQVIKKYQKNDAFIHVARDIKDPIYIDGKYTATLIEAGLSGCIIFWHDTFHLGNSLKTVFELPLETDKAAKKIKEIIKNIDVREHSVKTHQEMLDNFNPQKSVKIRADAILKDLKVR